MKIYGGERGQFYATWTDDLTPAELELMRRPPAAIQWQEHVGVAVYTENVTKLIAMVERLQEWCGKWHRTVEVMLTVAELSPALGADEAASAMQDKLHAKDIEIASLRRQLAERDAEIERLTLEINSPVISDWFDGVRIEAVHQRERWGAEHDAGKQPHDWFWLLGYLGGKCLASHIGGNVDKAKHHTISTGAALYNWFLAITGQDTRMRPGIEEPKP